MQQGLVEQADHGTLFLDEIDALSSKSQVVLLRFLQDQGYKPLGSSRLRAVDLRIIAATNADLQSRWMEHYHWPGNIRELENTLLRAFLISDGEAIRSPQATIDSMSNDLENTACQESPLGFQAAKRLPISEFERDYLIQLMAVAEGNVTRAARIAGKERRSLGKLLKKYDLPTESRNSSAL